MKGRFRLARMGRPRKRSSICTRCLSDIGRAPSFAAMTTCITGQRATASPILSPAGAGRRRTGLKTRRFAIPGDVFVKDVDSLGRPLSDKDYDDLIYHAIRCDVDGSQVTMTVIRLDGSVIDHVTLGPK